MRIVNSFLINGLTIKGKSGILIRMNVNRYNNERLTFGQEVWKLNGFLQLVKALAVYNDGAFDGYVIARVLWNIGGECVCVDTTLVRQRPGYAVIRVTGRDQDKNETGFLQITLWKPKAQGESLAEHSEQKGMQRSVMQEWMQKDRSDADGTITIMQEQIDQYLDLVQDTNPIHRGSNAIVPGLYMLYELQDRKLLQEFFAGHVCYEAVFHQPLPVGIACQVNVTNAQVWLAAANTTYFTIHKRVE